MLPDALLLKTPEEPFDAAVLRWRVRGDELLTQSIVPTGRPESPTLVDQPVVAPNDRGPSRGPQRPEPSQAGLLERTFPPPWPDPGEQTPSRCTPDHGSRGRRPSRHARRRHG